MQVLAHRGSSWEHPENTVEAFAAALADGATGIETDLRLSRDGLIVLAHDSDLLRTAGDPRHVSDLTTDELREVRVGRAHRLALLPDLLSLAAGKVRLNLEIKAPGVARALVPFLAGCDADILVTSGLIEELRCLRELLPGVPAGPVLEHLGEPERGTLAAWRPQAVSLSVQRFSAPHVEFCHQLGAEILIWVVNDPAQVLDLAAAGVDGIFTDRPRPVLRALRKL